MSITTARHGPVLPRGGTPPDPARRTRAAARGVALVAAAAFGLSSAPSAAQSDQAIQDLKRQMETLQKKIEKLESAPAKAARPGPVKGSFFVPGTNTAIKFGGWVQTDFMTDFSGDAGDLFAASRIPLQDQSNLSRSNESTRVVARNSRFNFTSMTPTSFGMVKGLFEMDFRGSEGTETLSNSAGVRLRHAYAEFPAGKNGKILVGQTWSNAFSLGTAASSVSWVSSEGGLFVRQPQIRYTRNLGNGTDFRLSLENPEARIAAAPADNGAFRGALNDLYPDVVAKFTFRGGWGRGDVAFINQFPRLDRGGISETAYAWGLSANVGLKVTRNDTAYVQTSFGQGLGRYLNASFQSGFVVNNSIELSDQAGVRLGFKHKVNENLTFNLFGGVEQNESPTGFSGDPNITTWSTHANAFYRPFPESAKNLWLAVEFIHGERETESGRKGEANRLHFATRYRF
jgi:DcaP outer membrane protein